MPYNDPRRSLVRPPGQPRYPGAPTPIAADPDPRMVDDPNQYGPQRPGAERPVMDWSGPGGDGYGPHQPRDAVRYGGRPEGQPRNPPGLLDTPPNESPGSFSAHTQQVQGNQLMSTHMDSLLDQNSPLMQRAAQQGIDFAASRGLGNSSIAAGNAMGSMMDRAMPIAQFDASRYGSVADQNMSAMNQVGMFNEQQRFNYADLNQRDRHFGMDFNQRDSHFGQGLAFQYADLAQNNDQFRQTLQYNYADLSQRDKEFLASFGLNERKFTELQRQFDTSTEEGRRQFDATYGLNRDQFAENVRQFGMTFDQGIKEFEATLGFNYDQLDAQQRNFLATIGLDERKFEAAKDQFDRRMEFEQGQWDDEIGLRNRALYAEIYSSAMNTLSPILSSVFTNPNLSATEQRTIADYITGTIFPGMTNAAFNSIPAGLISPNAIQWAQVMPPFVGPDPNLGPTQPGTTPGTTPTGSGPGDIQFERPPGLSDYAWQQLQDAVRNGVQQP